MFRKFETLSRRKGGTLPTGVPAMRRLMISANSIHPPSFHRISADAEINLALAPSGPSFCGAWCQTRESSTTMLKDGTYVAWFKTPQGEGTGLVHLANGRIWGRDGIMNYDGTCQVDGDRFTATVTTKRHGEGAWPTVFGSHDDLRLKLEGTCLGKTGHYVGTAEQFPGVLLEGTLIFQEEQLPKPEANIGMSKFDPSRLPKLPKRSR